MCCCGLLASDPAGHTAAAAAAAASAAVSLCRGGAVRRSRRSPLQQQQQQRSGGESTRRWEELQTNRAVWRPVATRIPIKAFVLLAYLRKVHNPSLQHVIWFAENHTSNKSYPNLEVTKDARSH